MPRAGAGAQRHQWGPPSSPGANASQPDVCAGTPGRGGAPRWVLHSPAPHRKATWPAPLRRPCREWGSPSPGRLSCPVPRRPLKWACPVGAHARPFEAAPEPLIHLAAWKETPTSPGPWARCLQRPAPALAWSAGRDRAAARLRDRAVGLPGVGSGQARARTGSCPPCHLALAVAARQPSSPRCVHLGSAPATAVAQPFSRGSKPSLSTNNWGPRSTGWQQWGRNPRGFPGGGGQGGWGGRGALLPLCWAGEGAPFCTPGIGAREWTGCPLSPAGQCGGWTRT